MMYVCIYVCMCVCVCVCVCLWACLLRKNVNNNSNNQANIGMKKNQSYKDIIKQIVKEETGRDVSVNQLNSKKSSTRRHNMTKKSLFGDKDKSSTFAASSISLSQHTKEARLLRNNAIVFGTSWG